MVDSSQETIGIIVAGDNITDEYLYPEEFDERVYYNFGVRYQYESKKFNGGARLIKTFLNKTISNKKIKIHLLCDGNKFITREVLKKYPQIQHFNTTIFQKDPGFNLEIFRGDKFLGVTKEATASDNNGLNEFKIEESEKIRYIIINDIGKGFRENNEKCEELKNLYLKNKDDIVKVFLKINPPFLLDSKNTTEENYRLFLDLVKNKLVLIANLKDLRYTGANISYRLSWEKTAEDTLYEIKNNIHLNILTQCDCLVIRIGLEGALIIQDPSKESENFTGNLFFDLYSIEDEFLENSSGNIQGISIAFLCGLVKNSINNQNEIISITSIQEGLNLARMMWVWGYGRGKKPTRVPEEIGNNENSLDKKTIDDINSNNSARINSVEINLKDIAPRNSDELWTILEKNREKESIGEIAYNIVEEGLNQFQNLNFPVFQIGNLITVDRSEIESYQSIKNIIKAYIESEKINTPLPIAIFGPSGSGKSFGIKEILENLQKTEIKILSYNLSQFSDNSQLISAFHKIRDYTLIGQLPLVFFDEFDCKFNKEPYGWIKFFISPMQDGSFFDGVNSHPIGRCIFVFAGGVCENYSSFMKEHDKDRGIKIKDFVSRLRGHINIIGCNPVNKNDESYKIRRAILLRSLLLKKAPQIMKDNSINIEHSVMRAFIKIPKYNHEIRSMQAIVEMSNLKGKTKYEPSALPSSQQLSLHVSEHYFSNLILRDIHFLEKSKLLPDIILSSYQKELKLLFPPQVNSIFELSDKQKIDLKNNIQNFVNRIPEILNILDYGFVQNNEKPEIEKIAINGEKIQKLSEIPSNEKFILKTDLNLIEKLPQIMKEVGFNLYKL